MRSFSEKAFSGSPMLTLASWALKNECISNGRDRCMLPARNRMKGGVCIYDEVESIELSVTDDGGWRRDLLKLLLTLRCRESPINSQFSHLHQQYLYCAYCAARSAETVCRGRTPQFSTLISQQQLLLVIISKVFDTHEYFNLLTCNSTRYIPIIGLPASRIALTSHTRLLVVSPHRPDTKINKISDLRRIGT